MKKLALVITTGQPLDLYTENTIKQAATENDMVLVLIGSSNRAYDYTRPFNFNTIKQHIFAATGLTSSTLRVEPIKDTLYNDAAWTVQVHNEVDVVVRELADAISIGENQQVKAIKDDVMVIYYTSSENYADEFPMYSAVITPNRTKPKDIIESLYKGELSREVVSDYMYEFLTTEYINSEHGQNMLSEYMYIAKYKQAWSAAPYQPTFVTTDAVVYFRGYVLLVKRKANPGRGLWALPGGFINQFEEVENSLVRELKEETRIKVSTPILKSNIRNIQVFSDPHRSLRGRTITHAGLIVLDGVTSIQSLPAVKGSDDAEYAKWFSLSEVDGMASQMFEDHYFIVKKMLHVS